MSSDRTHPSNGRASAIWLSGLVLLLPFEPRAPTLSLFGLTTTVLEAAAVVVVVALLWLERERLVGLARRPPAPLLWITAFAAAHVESALVADDHRSLALKFALRMAAMALLATLVAAVPAAALGLPLAAVAAAGTAVALLAIPEGLGEKALDPLLGLFRESPFNVGGLRRASAGSEYPNLAAAFLADALLAGVGLASRLARPARAVVPWAALVCGALLLTYSRGALLAAAAGLAVLGGALVARDGSAWRSSPALRAWAAGLAVLGTAAAVSVAPGSAFRLRLETEGIERWYDAAYTPDETSLVLAPGERRATTVRVTNRGLRPWTTRESFHLSYHWYSSGGVLLGDGERAVLPDDVAPGASVLLRPSVEAPRREGGYLLGWDMVQEHTTWFSAQGVPVGAVPVAVARGGSHLTAASGAPLAAAVAWRPGRGELWRIAGAMWRAHPVFGVGSDNYRWLYGPQSGHLAWDSRVFANNTLLEVAATTGTVGALALAGTLAAAAVSAWRAVMGGPRGSVEAAAAGAILALLAGLVAHGLVDYVLAFTGHYLVFGLVIGAAAALGRKAEA